MRILAIISGEYGQRHVDNIREHGPQDWTIEVWQAPGILPPMIDYPEDYVPDDLPPADLVLSFAENKGVAELLPDVARVTGAKEVMAAVDSEKIKTVRITIKPRITFKIETLKTLENNARLCRLKRIISK